MKRFLVVLALVLLFLSAQSVQAFDSETNYQTREGKKQQQIMEIGFKILNANKIDKRILFFYKSKNPVINAFATPTGKSVIIAKGIMPFCETEDEVAAVISHEIAHNLDFYNGVMYTASMMIRPKKYEYKADKRGVDLMVNAGYNPLAMIVTFNKFMKHQSLLGEAFSTHPNASKRMMEVYEYIYVKYPQFLVNNEYKNNVYYQNFLITSADNRKKLENKLKNPRSGIVEVRYK